MSEEPNTQERGLRKERVGIVVSDKMDKTIVVAVIRRVPHPKFKKIVKLTTKLYAQDDKGEAKVGDKVIVTLDESNVLLDIHDPSRPVQGHRILVGNLAYADPVWEVVEIFTSKGLESFSVDPLTSSKLGVLQEGALVRAELDEANVLIDIHPYHR